MRKSTIFISSVLTTFALVMLYGVVSAYRGNLVTTASPTAVPTQEIPIAMDTDTPTVVTPEQAAQLAVQVIGHDNLLSAESFNFNGVNAYKITFTNNDVVYVGVDGQILSVQVAPVVVNVQAPARSRNNKNNDNNESKQEDHDEHDEHDD